MARVHPSTSWLERCIAEAGVVAVLLVWYVWARDVPAYVLPPPQAVFARMGQLIVEPGFAMHVGVTLGRVILAIVIAMIIGTTLALLPWFEPRTELIVNQRVLPFFSAFPAIGWVLLATVWFKVSPFTVVFIQVAILIPFCLINVAEGVRALDDDMVEMGRSFSRRRTRVFWRVMLPMLVPYLMASLRIGYGVAWKIALVAELFGAKSGLGYTMLQAQVYGDSELVLAACLMIVALFMLGDRLVIAPLSRRFETKH